LNGTLRVIEAEPGQVVGKREHCALDREIMVVGGGDNPRESGGVSGGEDPLLFGGVRAGPGEAKASQHFSGSEGTLRPLRHPP